MNRPRTEKIQHDFLRIVICPKIKFFLCINSEKKNKPHEKQITRHLWPHTPFDLSNDINLRANFDFIRVFRLTISLTKKNFPDLFFAISQLLRKKQTAKPDQISKCRSGHYLLLNYTKRFD